MVAKVISGKDIQGALNYNEQKVQQGKAECIQAHLFKADITTLNFYDKLSRFNGLNERNKRTKTNTLHISLNFDPSEKLSVDNLNRIASTYMQKIGFGDQPYLVYEHLDAAHPHIHIVTTIIQENGKRIPIHFLGKNQSEKARCEIELEFGLVQARDKSIQQSIHRPIHKATYGKSETKKSIVNIVSAVTRSYKYTSLPELNAALRQYNVIADRGSERSQMYQKRGLLYSIIDKKGNRVGIPLKASSIYGKPTLTFLEKQFKLNEVLRQPDKAKLTASIDTILNTGTMHSKQRLVNALQQHDIAVVFRTNEEGRTYGVTFIDNRTRVVFNGSALGKSYSAAAILQRLSDSDKPGKSLEPDRPNPSRTFKRESHNDAGEALAALSTKLTEAEERVSYSPEAALRLQRRKRRKRPRL